MKIKSWLPIGVILLLAACSSGSSSPTPTSKQTTTIAGAVDDAFVASAQVTPFQVNANGTLGAAIPCVPTTGCPASSDANGNYTVNLGSYSGPVVLQASGGSYTDTATGQVVPMPAGLTLSVLLPAVAPGTTNITAQITALTTIAAQLAFQQMGQGVVATTAAQATTAAAQAYFGLSDIVATQLLNLNVANCGSGAAEASYDASLVLAGISELASTYKVTSIDLALAIAQDITENGSPTGTNYDGTPINVPLADGSGSVALATIYGSGLAKSLDASISTFEASTANACKAMQPPPVPKDPPSLGTQITVVYVYTTGSPLPAATAHFTWSSNGATCGGTSYAGGLGTFSTGFIPVQGGGGDQNTSVSTCLTPSSLASWTMYVDSPSGQSCTPSKDAPESGTFTGVGSIGATTTPSVIINCSTVVASTYTVSAAVTGLTGGTLVLQVNTVTSVNVTASGIVTLASGFAAGTNYAVSIVTQPAGETCTLGSAAAGTVNANVTVNVSCGPTGGGTPSAEAIYVIDSTDTLFKFDSQGNFVASAGLHGPVSNLNGGGINTDANNVYVTLGAPSNRVSAFDRTTLAPVTLPGFGSTAVPRAIVFDPQNSQFYIANGASTVTVYNSAGTLLSTFNQSGPGIYGPSGISYDSIDNAVWVANYTGGGAGANPTYGIAEFSPSGTIVNNYPTANTNPPTPFAPPVNTGHEMPYSIAYCGNTLTVGYISDTTNLGNSQAGGYSTAGTLLSAPFEGITNLHAIACAQDGNVFVAADNGLLEYNYETGAAVALPGSFTGIKAPIYGVGVGPGPGLNSPEGLVYSNGTLYVANSGNNQVLIYTVQTNASGVVTGMTVSGRITADINDPVRLALDAAGHLFVANLGNNTVTAYDTTNGNVEITSAGKPLISGGSLNRPLGVAVDAKENVYVADNGTNNLSVFQPVTAGSLNGGYTEALFSPLSQDATGNAFPAPGVLFDVNLLGQDYLLVGLGPTTGANYVYLYEAPFTAAPSPVGDVSSVNSGVTCIMPTGPTGIALIPNHSNPLASQIFVTSFYNSSVFEYMASSLIGSAGTCPTPAAMTAARATSLVSGPEGTAVDSTGTNVFVSNAATNTITVYGSGTALSGAPVFTLHN